MVIRICSASWYKNLGSFSIPKLGDTVQSKITRCFLSQQGFFVLRQMSTERVLKNEDVPSGSWEKREIRTWFREQRPEYEVAKSILKNIYTYQDYCKDVGDMLPADSWKDGYDGFIRLEYNDLVPRLDRNGFSARSKMLPLEGCFPVDVVKQKELVAKDE